MNFVLLAGEGFENGRFVSSEDFDGFFLTGERAEYFLGLVVAIVVTFGVHSMG